MSPTTSPLPRETKDGTVDDVEVKEEVEVTEVKSDDEEQKSDDDKKE